MEIILFAIIILQLALMIYLDIQNRAERERLQLKLMSDSLSDYVSSTKEAEDSPKQEEDPYVDMSEVSVDDIVGAKEKE